jgi:hypothetical protein
MSLPLGKNRKTIALLHENIAGLDEQQQASIMNRSGQGCADDILALCEKILRRKVNSVEDLVGGWNRIRKNAGLKGKWEIDNDEVRGIFSECGCPLVRSGLIKLHPVQCYCSRGMLETIFSSAAGRRGVVELRQTIGRGGKVCSFVIKLK